MATLLHSESTRLYSWWWDSHISPKNSKWLQENLADMDTKVKAMIKLIEEDADSFARRAEMFYKKRPELMKLVEEFYRAYRALAERYDHATGELRQAHRTMAEAFPNQVPFVLADDSPSGSAQGTEPHTPEMPHPVRALFGPDDLHKDALGLSASDLHSVKKNGSCSGDSDAVSNKKGPKQLYEMFGSGKVRKGLNHDMEEKEESLTGEVFQLLNENENLKTKVLSESERAGKAESEVQNLKKALIDVQAEKEAVLSQYQQSLEKLSSLEGELICAEKDLSRLKVQASKAESEFLTLKETIIKLEAERDAGLTKIKDCLERISCLEDVGVEVLAHENICQELVEDQNSPIPDGILDLQKLQNRIKAVEKVLVEEMNRVERQESSSSNNIKLEAAVREIESLKSKCRPFQEKDKQKEEERGLWDETSDNLKLQKAKPEHPEVKNGILMKDIPLDQVSDCSLYGRSRRGNSQADEQMLVLWETSDNYRSSVGQNLTELQKQDYETTEDDIVYNQFEDADQRSNNPSSELEMEELGVDKLQVSTSVSMPNRGGNKKKILERLASDGQKLANIQTSVDDLRRKLETNKKSKNSKNVDFQTVKEQLQEVEETAVQLFDLNVQMARKIEGIPFSSDGKGSTELDEAVSVQKKRVLEQARKGSEKIGRLQLEIQKIQDVLLKLEDEKKSKGKNRFSRTKSRTTIILRDFIHSGKRCSVRQNKDRPCGCFKPSASGEANI